MKKFSVFKAFTIIELMVSIFITITIIASFYKLYEASLKTERSASIRVAENLMGEQMLDTLSESFRLIGLNSVKTDLRDDGTGIFRQINTETSPTTFVYLSPYGSPITKVASVSETYPNCEFTLFNSASFYTNISKLYFHNQNGFFKTADGESSISDIEYGDNGVSLKTNGFNGTPGSDGDECKDVFPVGSLVTGEDFIYTLKYSPALSDNYLTLDYTKEDGTGGGNLINFSYKSSKTDNFYIMPKFVIEFLAEWKCGTDKCRKWLPNGTEYPKNHIKEITAIRFGFVLLSKKERITQGKPGGAGTLPRYCIFSADTGSTNKYCYDLEDLNYTASVFSRVVYLSNYRYLKDQSGN
ncbi:hypothetical protein IKS86_02010 [bacterium]|nr:hypothetical protein [bacterium]